MPGSGATFSVRRAAAGALDSGEPTSPRPILPSAAVLIVASAPIEASLLARRLRAGARTSASSPTRTSALALLPERDWDAMLVDHALGADMRRDRLAACVDASRAASC